MMPRIFTACFTCLVHSRADMKWDRLKENNFKMLLLRRGKQAQALLYPSSEADTNQDLHFPGKSSNTHVAAIHFVGSAG